MILSMNALEALDNHWAVSTIKGEGLERTQQIINQRLADHALGRQIKFSFSANENDKILIDQVALALELAAIEGLDELSQSFPDNIQLRDQATAASFRLFDIWRLQPVPSQLSKRLFFVLQLSSIAYCGDRWNDLRRWYKKNKDSLTVPSVAEQPWDRRILYRLFDCWVRLFRKDGWDDLDRVREIIADLRQDQKSFERDCLQNGSDIENKAMALRLIALYHWATATEILAKYMLQGEPSIPLNQLDMHFDNAVKAATASGDIQHEMILYWIRASARIMVTNSMWWAVRSVNSQTSEFVHSLATRQHHPMFELLPPQRAALLEQGLLDLAKTSIVIDLPTSGGKTLLAQFRILQALNQFDNDSGWVAYVVPTRALCTQLTRRLRTDFAPLNLRVEQLTSAIEVDAFEEDLLNETQTPFHILVSTPEKLSLVIRNKKVSQRSLALVVMDEAHNIESFDRGLRIELFLSTVKMDCPLANFLLLMPYVQKTESVARWLAQDSSSGQPISLGTTPWKPNERIIGLYSVAPNDTVRSGWHLHFETLTTTSKAMTLAGIHRPGKVKPISVPRSKVYNQRKHKQAGFGIQTAAMATIMSSRGTSIAIANNIQSVWKMAENATESLPLLDPMPRSIEDVQNFLRTEISPNFELIKTLQKGVGVHHSGLSDDVRALMEWLAETGNLKVLCATTTIAQGINFPVSSVFLQSYKYPYGKKMSTREFWNLAGRAGRIGHDSVGVVGLAEGSNRESVIDFVNRETGALVSRMVSQLNELEKQGKITELSSLLWQDQWEDFRCYISHLWAEKKNLDAVLQGSEQLLRNTFGYISLRSDSSQRSKADALLQATRAYVKKLSQMPVGVPELADMTGFSPEGVRAAITKLNKLNDKISLSDWAPESLFGDGGRISDLYGVMLSVPQLQRQLTKITGEGQLQVRISEITRDWVNGESIETIVNKHFLEKDGNPTKSITDACQAIYRTISNAGTWGVAGLSRVSGLSFEDLSDADRRKINMLPAMIYHGVQTESAVLMRMNAIPRSIAENLGKLYHDTVGGNGEHSSVARTRDFLKTLDQSDWQNVCPRNSALSGEGYRRLWGVLSGELTQ
ncbi:MAG: DEAD/DEAH box helicase [Bacteroidetes bacterium]|nr:DEAD/DEAH box helicase [Bacteroidota bacterium]